MYKNKGEDRASLMVQMVKNPHVNAKDLGLILSWGDPLEEEMATHSRILAWEIPWTKESGQAAVHGAAKSWTQLSA